MTQNVVQICAILSQRCQKSQGRWKVSNNGVPFLGILSVYIFYLFAFSGLVKAIFWMLEKYIPGMTKQNWIFGKMIPHAMP